MAVRFGRAAKKKKRGGEGQTWPNVDVARSVAVQPDPARSAMFGCPVAGCGRWAVRQGRPQSDVVGMVVRQLSPPWGNILFFGKKKDLDHLYNRTTQIKLLG